MNHKRKGPKSTRAGCLMCKPHKRQGAKRSERTTVGVRRQSEIAMDEAVQIYKKTLQRLAKH